VVLAALAPELEAKPRTLDGDVLAPERSEPIGVILAGVLLVADSDQGRLEQADHCGQHLLSRQAWRARSCSTRSRILGSAFPKSMRRAYFV